MKRLLIALTLMPSLTMAATSLAPGDYHVRPCPKAATLENCERFFPPKCVELNATACKPFFPVVEQKTCPAATVLPQPDLLPVDDPPVVVAGGSDGPRLVAPAAETQKLKTWHKWAIATGILVLGGVIEHQFDNDDGGDDNHKKPDDYLPPPPPPCDPPGHGHGHGHDDGGDD
jgi:hypothetical protein